VGTGAGRVSVSTLPGATLFGLPSNMTNR